jgi:HPt (histidine-containing phosphotransfer) domain-containing protein
LQQDVRDGDEFRQLYEELLPQLMHHSQGSISNNNHNNNNNDTNLPFWQP